jgi:molybdopterin biosynthesis enzyme
MISRITITAGSMPRSCRKRGSRYYARLTGPQGSGILTSMALANGLAIVPEDKPELLKVKSERFDAGLAPGYLISGII